MKYIKIESIDHIIETLSKPNDQSKLQSVAKDLLSLQKFVNSSKMFP